MATFVNGAPVSAVTPLDNLYYCSPTGSAAASGRSASDPITFREALARLGKEGWQRYGAIYMAAGTHTWASAIDPINVPASNYPGAFPLQIIGTWVDSGEGVMTVASVVASGSTTGGTVTVTGKAWATNQWVGARARFTGGASSLGAARNSILIHANTADTLTFPPASNAAAASDTLVIETRGTILDLPANTTFVGSGVRLFLRGVKVQVHTDLYLKRVELLTEGASFEVNAAAALMRINGDANAAAYLTTTFKFPWAAKTSAYAAEDLAMSDAGVLGTYFLGKSGALNAFVGVEYLELLRALCVNFGITSGPAGTNVWWDLNRSEWRGDCGITCVGTGYIALRRPRFVGCTTTQFGTGYLISVKGQVYLDSATEARIETTTTSTGLVRLADGATANLVSVGGANAGAGVPVVLATRSGLRATGCTVTGTAAGTDVTVGGNATATWAAVQTATGTHDGGSANPQFCNARN